MDRQALTDRWFTLTRERLPALAAPRGWPVRFDHCFQRILLDNAVGGPWRDHVAAPAWRNAADGILAKAIALGEAAAAGEVDLAALTAARWRGAASCGARASPRWRPWRRGSRARPAG